MISWEMLKALDLYPFYLTFKLAFCVSIFLIPLSILLLHWIHTCHKRLRPILDVVFLMPLVLPPSVFGFYFLLLFSPQSRLGHFFSQTLGVDLVFSFQGIVLGSIIFSLPFALQPMQAHLQTLPRSIIEAGYALGGNQHQIFYRIELPMIRNSILLGLLMSFAHTLGEFGLILMIGGNLPYKTQVASIAIFQHVESLEYASAHLYAILLSLFAFILLFGISLLRNKLQKNIGAY